MTAVPKPLIRLGRNPTAGRLLARFFHDRIPHRGCVIDTTSPWIDDYTKASIFWGMYEKGETIFVERFLRPDNNVIELGASVGVVGSHIGKRLDRGRVLVCVEANPNLLPAIETNLRLNAPHLNPAVVNAAVDYSGRESVPVGIARRNIDSRVRDTLSEGSVLVNPVTLRQLVREHALGSYFLVADVEGSEHDLLEHESGSLAKCRFMVIELHDSGSGANWRTIADAVTVLEERHGFALRKRRGNVFAFENTHTPGHERG